MTKLNTNKDVITVGELKHIIKEAHDDARIRYRKVNVTTGEDVSLPVHRADVSDTLLFLVTEYIEQTSLDNYKELK